MKVVQKVGGSSYANVVERICKTQEIWINHHLDIIFFGVWCSYANLWQHFDLWSKLTVYTISLERSEGLNITLKMGLGQDIYRYSFTYASDRLLLTFKQKKTHNTTQSNITKTGHDAGVTVERSMYVDFLRFDPRFFLLSLSFSHPRLCLFLVHFMC